MMTTAGAGDGGGESAEIYGRVAVAQIPRLLGTQDRQPDSPTYGCFDREYWSWKFRDFPLGMLQSAVYPAALLWRHAFTGSEYRGNDRLLEWIAAGIRFPLDRQHRDGSIDAFAPNERSAGPTLGIMHGLSEAYRLVGKELDAALSERFLTAFRKASDLALTRQEDHAFVSNHWALFAVTLHTASELLDDPRYAGGAEAVIDRILAAQSPEGWYDEYGGPDPGYESLGIFHLSVFHERTGDERVLASLRRSVDFYAHCVHPDGGVGGVYGRRRTSLYFPAGFESLADRLPRARAIARHMRSRLTAGAVVTPAAVDTENLASLLYTYLEADRAAGVRASRSGAGPESGEDGQLPIETLRGTRLFEGAQLAVAGNDRCWVVVSGANGGGIRVFDRTEGSELYRDAGYVVREGGRSWASSGARGTVTAAGPEALAVESPLALRRVATISPGRQLLLRLANLTVFRSPAAGRWLRGAIVSRLMRPGPAGPLRLHRRIELDAAMVRIEDELTADSPVAVEAVRAPVALTPFHMGSAGYFHPVELKLATAELPDMAAELAREGRAPRVLEIEAAPAVGRERSAGLVDRSPGTDD